MKKVFSFLLCTTILLFFAGCGGGGGGDGGSQGLTVSQESPVVDAVNVPAKVIISAVFNQKMARGTLSATSFLVASAGGAISGSVVCTGSTASFLPDVPLLYDTVYTATITTEAESLDGSTLVNEHSWNFKTVEAGPGDPDNYIPFTQGSLWTYEGTLTENNNTPVKYNNTRSINGTIVVDGKTTTIFIESNPDNLGQLDAYLYKDLDGITDYGTSSPEPFIQQLSPYQEINFPTDVGDSYIQVHKADLDAGSDLDGDGVNESFDILSRLTMVSLDTVTVPVGTYMNCAQIKLDIQITIYLSRDNSKYISQGTDKYWYAPGVGRLKYTSDFKYSDGSKETLEEVLILINI